MVVPRPTTHHGTITHGGGAGGTGNPGATITSVIGQHATFYCGDGGGGVDHLGITTEVQTTYGGNGVRNCYRYTLPK